MSDHQPWVMAVQAGAASAAERARLAQAVSRQIGGQRGCVLVSTCHRVELYGFGAMPDVDARLQVQTGEGAVRHLIRVAAGLESTIIGEDEVLHQVRDALAQARESRPLDNRLLRLFETAIAAGRRTRAGRTASSGNLAQSAVAWLEKRSTLAGRTVLVVGAGRMGSCLAHAARLAGAELTVAMRSPVLGSSSSRHQANCPQSRISRHPPPSRLASGPASMVAFLGSTICTSARSLFLAATSMRRYESSQRRRANTLGGWAPSDRP